MNLCIDQQTKKKVAMIQPDSRKYFSQLILTLFTYFIYLPLCRSADANAFRGAGCKRTTSSWVYAPAFEWVADMRGEEKI